MTDTGLAGARRAIARIIAPLLTVGLLLPMLAATAYYRIFAVFNAYDDEGYVLLLIDQVRRGKVLGQQVFAQYGPAYPLTYAGLYSLAGLEVSHDSMRMITIVVWLLTALACWFVCYSATGNLAAAMVVVLLAFQCGGVLVNEPGHPQGIVTLAAALIPVVAAVLLPAQNAFLRLAGAIAGYVLMSKINVGLFASAALALSLVAATPGALARRLTWLLAAAAIFAPALLMWQHLDTLPAARLALVAGIGSAAIGAPSARSPQSTVLAAGLDPGRGRPVGGRGRRLRGGAAPGNLPAGAGRHGLADGHQAPRHPLPARDPWACCDGAGGRRPCGQPAGVPCGAIPALAAARFHLDVDASRRAGRLDVEVRVPGGGPPACLRPSVRLCWTWRFRCFGSGWRQPASRSAARRACFAACWYV